MLNRSEIYWFFSRRGPCWCSFKREIFDLWCTGLTRGSVVELENQRENGESFFEVGDRREFFTSSINRTKRTQVPSDGHSLNFGLHTRLLVSGTPGSPN